jgi:hypothetical protein
MVTAANGTGEYSERFLELVDFKWLMAGLGWRVDLTRLQQDTAYVGECALRGLSSELPLLRQRSSELLASLTH